VITNSLDFEDESQRRRAVAWVVALASTSAAAAPPAETPAATADGLYRVLYSSHAHPISKAQLLDLLEQARSYNVAHHLTGVLLYSEGRFVQLIEGPEAAVRALYERIANDSRHHDLESVKASPIISRQFAEWSMDFGFALWPEGEAAPGPDKPATDLPALSITSDILKRLLETFIG
jgi:hypothetical protein